MTYDPSDLEARREARRIGDETLWALWDIVCRRGDNDRLWEIPGDLGQQGDGTGLLAILRSQVIAPGRAAIEAAERAADELEQRIEERKRRVIGPNYRPTNQVE